jgi:hypothetical protein
MPVKWETSGRPRRRDGALLLGSTPYSLTIRDDPPGVDGGVTLRIGAVWYELTTGAGVLLRSAGVLAALPMPLGSDSDLGLAGPKGTPLIGVLPAPADPAGGVNCAKACPGRTRLPSTARTNAVMRDIGTSASSSTEI